MSAAAVAITGKRLHCGGTVSNIGHEHTREPMCMNTSPNLTGKSVLVTGAARRIGAAVAQALHAQGANVIVHYRSSAQAAEELCRTLNAARGDSALALQADLTDTSALAGLIERVVQGFGRLDILLNNASSFYPTPLGGITGAHWDDLMATNLKAPLFLSQAAAPHLRRTSGLILNMTDIHAVRPLRQHTVYCIAKAGLVMLTRSLARELGPQVRVNGIAPGPILWPAGGADDDQREQVVSRTALKRMGEPGDIARAVLYFAKDAPYVTGQILAVDGGRSIGW
jgi:pteridine reductase